MSKRSAFQHRNGSAQLRRRKRERFEEAVARGRERFAAAVAHAIGGDPEAALAILADDWYAAAAYLADHLTVSTGQYVPVMHYDEDAPLVSGLEVLSLIRTVWDDVLEATEPKEEDGDHDDLILLSDAEVRRELELVAP